MRTPAFFLDRDGVIVREVNYLHKPEDVEIIGEAAKAISLINQASYPVVIITNQAGVARGFYSEADVRGINAYIIHKLSKSGAKIKKVYYCPHHPKAGQGKYLQDCPFRKPNPGMLIRAATELHLDLKKSIFIGDNFSDILAGKQAGTRTILVRTGYGEKVLANPEHISLGPDAVCDDLIAATEHSFDAGWFQRG